MGVSNPRGEQERQVLMPKLEILSRGLARAETSQNIVHHVGNWYWPQNLGYNFFCHLGPIVEISDRFGAGFCFFFMFEKSAFLIFFLAYKRREKET